MLFFFEITHRPPCLRWLLCLVNALRAGCLFKNASKQPGRIYQRLCWAGFCVFPVAANNKDSLAVGVFLFCFVCARCFSTSIVSVLLTSFKQADRLYPESSENKMQFRLRETVSELLSKQQIIYYHLHQRTKLTLSWITAGMPYI